jgi:hypothetical protein
MPRRHLVRLCSIAVSAIGLTLLCSACELLVDFDRSKIPTEAGTVSFGSDGGEGIDATIPVGADASADGAVFAEGSDAEQVDASPDGGADASVEAGIAGDAQGDAPSSSTVDSGDGAIEAAPDGAVVTVDDGASDDGLADSTMDAASE